MRGIWDRFSEMLHTLGVCVCQHAYLYVHAFGSMLMVNCLTSTTDRNSGNREGRSAITKS